MDKLHISWMSFSEHCNTETIENLSRFGFKIECFFRTNDHQSSLIIINSDTISSHKMMKFIIDLRRTIPHIPVIIICYCDSFYRANLLSRGIDDIVSPSIHPIELYARIIALHKRYDKGQYIKKVGGFHIDYLNRIISHHDIQIPLTPREYLLLEYLIKNAHKPISRANILYHLWNCRHDPGTNSVEVHIWRLRQKMLEYVPDAPQIKTIKNKGYTIFTDQLAPHNQANVALI